MQSNTAAVENQPITFANFSVENRKPDPSTIEDGHYIGHDGFVVPRDFDEFHERFPQYVRQWVGKHADRLAQHEDMEDWTQDLLILNSLPSASKHRAAGKKDVIQTFDPAKHYGASSARFFNYINLCLGNKFRTIRSKRMKNPLCCPGNVSLSTRPDNADQGQVTDEFCHSHSAHFRKRCERQLKGREGRHLIAEFEDFVRYEDSSVIPAMEAILESDKPSAAAEFLGVAEGEFGRMRSRLRQLGKCFSRQRARTNAAEAA